MFRQLLTNERKSTKVKFQKLLPTQHAVTVQPREKIREITQWQLVTKYLQTNLKENQW